MTLDGPGLISVIEFGATARGDTDDHSDRDVFVLSDDAEPAELIKLREHVAAQLGMTDISSVTCFTTSTMDRMLDFGSLFLLHLRLEGRTLVDRDGIAAEGLSRLRPYAAFETDLKRFQEVTHDVGTSIHEFANLNSFEAHVLFGIARNTCMLLTVRANRPTFGRRAVFQVARELFDELPLAEATYATLQRGHLAYHRHATVGWTDKNDTDAESLIKEITQLLDFAEQQCL